MSQNSISVYGATQFAVGLSQVVKVNPSAYETARTLKIASAGTSAALFITRQEYSGASTQAGGSYLSGYPIGSSEIFQINSPAVFYLAATGATVTVAMTIGYTNGATVL